MTPPVRAPSAIATSWPTEWMAFAAGSSSSATVIGMSALPATVDTIATSPHRPTNAKTSSRDPIVTPTSAPATAAADATSLQISTFRRGSRSTTDAAIPPPTIGGTRRMPISSATCATDDVDSYTQPTSTATITQSPRKEMLLPSASRRNADDRSGRSSRSGRMVVRARLTPASESATWGAPLARCPPLSDDLVPPSGALPHDSPFRAVGRPRRHRPPRQRSRRPDGG